MNDEGDVKNQKAASSSSPVDCGSRDKTSVFSPPLIFALQEPSGKTEGRKKQTKKKKKKLKRSFVNHRSERYANDAPASD